MHNGRHVAVKVQRPDLEAMIATDIAALTYLVALGESLFPRLRALDLPVLVREFANSLNRETDFSLEARSIMLFRTALADVTDLWIPDVVAKYSTGSVLTMEFSDGERVDLYARLHPEAMPRLINTLVRRNTYRAKGGQDDRCQRKNHDLPHVQYLLSRCFPSRVAVTNAGAPSSREHH